MWLQVAPSGSKSWIFRFKIAGRQPEMGLGGLHTIELAKARVLARECRSLLLDGRDPIEARKAVRLAAALQRARSMSFDQCAASYINAHRGSWKNANHADQWKNSLATYASPIIGAPPVADVGTDLVVKVLSPIWGAKTETAMEAELSRVPANLAARYHRLNTVDRSGGDFTQAGKEVVRNINKALNRGSMKCDNCKRDLLNRRVVLRIDRLLEAHVDHI